MSDAQQPEVFPRLAWDRAGRRIKVLAKTRDGYVVTFMHRQAENENDEDAEHWFSGYSLMPLVFEKEPVQIISAEIAALQAKHDELLAAIATIREQKNAAQVERDECLKRLKQYDALKFVDEFLDGKFTHFVIQEWNGIRIQTIEEALVRTSEYSRREEDLRMVSICGKFSKNWNEKNESIHWRISQYGDGSGSESHGHPCRSLEEAQEYARAMHRARFRDYLDGKLRADQVWDYIKGAQELGIEAPQQLIALKVHLERTRMANNIAEARAKLAALEAEEKQEQST